MYHHKNPKDLSSEVGRAVKTPPFASATAPSQWTTGMMKHFEREL